MSDPPGPLDELLGVKKRSPQLLAEIDQLLRARPKDEWVARTDVEWLGRAQAAMSRLDQGNAAIFRLVVTHLQASGAASDTLAPGNWAQVLTMLYEARTELSSRFAPPVVEVFDQGQRFEYFDEVRKLIELARNDLLFVDPYIDPEFVSVYLAQVPAGVAIRLLTYKHLKSALPAVDIFAQQHGLKISVRSDPSLHDRLLFVDGRECYFSGGSFKDGGKRSTVILMQIADAFDAVKQRYEAAWNAAKVERP